MFPLYTPREHHNFMRLLVPLRGGRRFFDLKGCHMNEAITQRYQQVCSDLEMLSKRHGRGQGDVGLVAVSKTFPSDDIEQVIKLGQRIFGENRVQELQDKWVGLKQQYPQCRVHLIGPLQSNKVRKAVQIADVIETVDRVDLVDRIVRIAGEEGRAPELFVQVNIGEEAQKAGCLPSQLADLVDYVRAHYKGRLRGLMVIPPADEEPAPYFAWTRRLADDLDLPECSMGMSGDYDVAIAQGSNLVRLGSAIFGPRT